STPTHCSICEAPLGVRFEAVRDFVSGEAFSILGCPACGLGVTSPAATDLARYYGAYWGGRHGFTAEYCARRRVKLLASMARLPPGSRVLDFGSGDGNFLRRTAREGWVSFGLEASFLPDNNAPGGYEVYTSLEAVKQRGPFDAITLWHVLEHLPDPVATLRELEGMLTPKGVIVIGVPDAQGVQAQTFGADWMHLDVPRHLFHFGRRSLEQLLARASLSPFRWWNHEFEYDLMGWSQSALAKVGMPVDFFEAVTGRIPFGLKWATSMAWGSAVSAAALPLAMKWGSSITVVARRVDPR
ncbi:MAG TPA: class I SAM-dependent methyltransferase, partial [Polyangiaceae bacterium]|nr:class I SAM-dependent methyltransferase [Polyangiaceae bacterium]